MDRRKQKSQDIIMKAFLELLKEKDLAKISMNEIAERANVNRGTIYLNFVDKYDLLEKCIAVNLADLIRDCKGTTASAGAFTKESLEQTFRYLEANIAFLRDLIANVGFLSIRKCILDEIQSSLRPYIIEETAKNNVRAEVAVQFFASALTGVLEWWLTSDTPCTAEEIADELWILLQSDRLGKLLHPKALTSTMSKSCESARIPRP
ncbi:TetR/AcrR family transcriptional regulator [Paenibacillus sp. NFR01]|uniref:TetR/AcrR family transcriptional regulator n=1 Tax=Paenibacillus sp. NFR01 TaxID=1566279 RepID=UPI0008CE17AC|nr:TetR/AcrR family transcriptional regulator [Paenibacillus sp. NFR01]SET09011.1 transcriptional regulator, TetR family [Paenibacillus sp. NFR01]